MSYNVLYCVPVISKHRRNLLSNAFQIELKNYISKVLPARIAVFWALKFPLMQAKKDQEKHLILLAVSAF